MTSNCKRTLGGMLTLAVVFSAAEARAQSLEKPGAAPAPDTSAAAAPSGPAGFGDAGQLTISGERMFGISYRRQSPETPKSTTTVTLLANPYGIFDSAYAWPRLGFDYFLVKGISAGLAASFFRSSNGSSNITGYELAPRVGYAATIGPWLSIWPRAGFTYVHVTQGGSLSYYAVTVEAPLVIAASQHISVLLGPSLDLGIGGTGTTKITDLAFQAGFALAF